MKTFDYAVALLISLAAVPANADVLFSTIHTPVTANSTRIEWPSTGTTGSVVRGGPLAQSFYVPSASAINSVSLRLNVNNPSDGGSVLVFIVPDMGLGGVGVASLPTFTGRGSTLALTGAIQIGSIADSLLSTSPAGALETFNTYLPISAGQYWLAVENTPGTGGIASTAKWVFDTTPYTTGVGTTDQSVFWQAGAVGSPAFGAPGVFANSLFSTIATTPGDNNLYIAEVDAPEPLGIAVLGVGLAGLGLARGRRSIRH